MQGETVFYKKATVLVYATKTIRRHSPMTEEAILVLASTEAAAAENFKGLIAKAIQVSLQAGASGVYVRLLLDKNGTRAVFMPSVPNLVLESLTATDTAKLAVSNNI